MSNTAKVTTWVVAAAAVLSVLLAALTYGASRATSSTQAAVMHESRHVRTESDVERIDDSTEAQFNIIQSQLAAINAMDVIILNKIIEK